MRLLWAFVLAFAVLSTTAAYAGDDKPKHKVTQSKSFVSLEPFYATVIDADKPCGLLLVEIGLDVPDESLRDRAQQALPILRDYYVRSLTNFAATTVRPWRQPDVVMIADRLQRVTDRALKQQGAKVLLAQVALRITR